MRLHGVEMASGGRSDTRFFPICWLFVTMENMEWPLVGFWGSDTDLWVLISKIQLIKTIEGSQNVGLC